MFKAIIYVQKDNQFQTFYHSLLNLLNIVLNIIISSGKILILLFLIFYSPLSFTSLSLRSSHPFYDSIINEVKKTKSSLSLKI